MINWELPPDALPCPHCASMDTHITLQLLGLIRYACASCRKSFAVQNGTETPRVTRASTPK
jgi:transposase-like protein